MTTNDKRAFVEKFIDIIADEGDVFFSSGNISKDFDSITYTIKQQGYWAGNSVRYMFNKKLEFEGVQPRMFGN